METAWTSTPSYGLRQFVHNLLIKLDKICQPTREQTTSQVKGLGTLCKGHDRQQGQSQHGSGAGGADVPLKMALLGLPARAEDELMRANCPPCECPLTHLGQRFYSSEMLGPEPWRVTSGPDMGEVQVLTSQGC